MEDNNQSQPGTSGSGGNTGLLVGGVVAILLIVGALAYFLMSRSTQTNKVAVSDGTNSEMPVDQNSGVDEMIVEDSDSMEEESIREISVDGNEYEFSPSSITVTEGEKVRLIFTNVGSMPHDFVIDELGVRSRTISGGGTDTVEFTANQSGTFSFYCSVGNHRALGMEGDLEVQ
jgi:plastocyanin